MSKFPRISFGLIVLNGEPFTRYNLRALYPYAYEIIVVEGAVTTAAAVSTSDGHSQDETLEVLRAFQAEEDPENKVKIIIKNGFWSEKDEMSQAYANAATGDYLWQIDSDEFYRQEDIEAIIQILKNDPTITVISVKMIMFWGDLTTSVDGWYFKRGMEVIPRVFKWGEGYQYITHRPPTIVDAEGIDLRKKHWINGYELAQQGILMYHYTLLLPKQVREKNAYYQSAFWSKDRRADALRWTEEVYMQLKNPFRVHNIYQYPSWLMRYTGPHPTQILQMWQDIDENILEIDRRPMADVEALLSSRKYRFQRFLVQMLDYPARVLHPLRWNIVYPLARRALPKRIIPFVKKTLLRKW